MPIWWRKKRDLKEPFCSCYPLTGLSCSQRFYLENLEIIGCLIVRNIQIRTLGGYLLDILVVISIFSYLNGSICLVVGLTHNWGEGRTWGANPPSIDNSSSPASAWCVVVVVVIVVAACFYFFYFFFGPPSTRQIILG